MNGIDYNGKKHTRKEWKEYLNAHPKTKCANCSFVFVALLECCPICGNKLGNKEVR